MSGSSKDRPILSLRVSAEDSGDDARLQNALVQIANREPQITVDWQPAARSHVVQGYRESLLDWLCDCLRDEYKLRITVGAPEAILLETIRSSGDAEGQYIRQVGGLGNYAHCKMRVDPNESGKGYSFISEVPDNVLPKHYISSIDRGVRNAMRSGILRGYPLVDLNVTVIDGSYHDNDSNSVAFEIAGSIAFKHAVLKASPVVLEPVMSIKIEMSDAFTTFVESDIIQLRGRIDRIWTMNGRSEIIAIVPLSELLISGHSSLSGLPAEFAGYEAVPDEGASNENGPGVTVNKPNYPRFGRRSAAAQPEPQDD